MIIGVCGLIGSGKGTVADILVSDYGFQKISFADKVKDGVSTIFGWDRSLLEGDTPESREWREQPDEFWTRETGKTITPRIVLQLFGTDCMRNGFDYGIWVSLVKQTIQQSPETNWVIPDVRFANEINMIQAKKGQVWWVRRGELPGWFNGYRLHNHVPESEHPSEWSWAKSSFDCEIHNDSDLLSLKNLVKDRLVSSEHLLSEVSADS